MQVTTRGIWLGVTCEVDVAPHGSLAAPWMQLAAAVEVAEANSRGRQSP